MQILSHQLKKKRVTALKLKCYIGENLENLEDSHPQTPLSLFCQLKKYLLLLTRVFLLCLKILKGVTL